ncbi:uncharacterized protein B0H18DRAFT_633735 [Fomitopsis serialis]|uniref:uncharacterized protein n=1 Tax=Fomitopsis serialis TaxID=139415 RepID=UPI0020078E69|nr:uncharacterized protein B0H18DRAFT_633735 [Neoantrodia serialis]KAH9919558.1 hypothetical protein B0H18DRAFT_633735 [Neoantrodia serialis]
MTAGVGDEDCALELRQHIPAPWKEEREARGLSLQGHRSLKDFLGAPAPSRTSSGNASAGPPPQEPAADGRIWPAGATIPRSPHEFFARTVTKLARKMKMPPPQFAKPPAEPTNQTQPHSVDTTRAPEPAAATLTQPAKSNEIPDKTPDAPAVQASEVTQQATTRAPPQAQGTSNAPADPTHAATVSHSAPTIQTFAEDIPVPSGSNSQAASGPAATDTQPADPSALPMLPAQAARPPKPPKATPRPTMNHAEFATLLRSCLSAEEDVAQDSVTKLKELAKGDAGAARVYALTKQMLAEQHALFVQRMQDEGSQLLEAELFHAWLVDCGSLVSLMSRLLRVHRPPSWRPIPGLARIAFAMGSALFNLQKDGGMFDVSWQASAPADGSPPRSVAKSTTPADKDSIAAAGVKVRTTLSNYDDDLVAIVLRYRAEHRSGGNTMRACEKRLGAALTAMVQRAELGAPGSPADCMKKSRRAMLQWAENVAGKGL